MEESDVISLNELPIGKIGFIKSLLSEGNERRRMLDLGVIPNTKVKPLYKSPAGDPIAYFIRGAVIALRNEDAQKIYVSTIK